MTLYLADRETARTAFELAGVDKGSLVVLMQDGVLLANRAPANIRVYALAPDVKRRGLGPVYQDKIAQVTYAELVELLFEHTVVNLG